MMGWTLVRGRWLAAPLLAVSCLFASACGGEYTEASAEGIELAEEEFAPGTSDPIGRLPTAQELFKGGWPPAQAPQSSRDVASDTSPDPIPARETGTLMPSTDPAPDQATPQSGSKR